MPEAATSRYISYEDLLTKMCFEELGNESLFPNRKALVIASGLAEPEISMLFRGTRTMSERIEAHITAAIRQRCGENNEALCKRILDLFSHALPLVEILIRTDALKKTAAELLLSSGFSARKIDGIVSNPPTARKLLSYYRGIVRISGIPTPPGTKLALMVLAQGN